MMNEKVDWFFEKDSQWHEEYGALRTLVLYSELTEELKWGCPCYTREKSNIVLIHGFKEYCALLFMQGALIKDPKGLLIQQTENVQAARQLRFTNIQDIVKNKAIIKDYVKQAIALDRAGTRVPLKKTKEYKMPEEFEAVLKTMPDLKKAFSDLTPGRQRGYLLYFSSAKQAKTREDRIEKYIPKILDGKGLED